MCVEYLARLFASPTEFVVCPDRTCSQLYTEQYAQATSRLPHVLLHTKPRRQGDVSTTGRARATVCLWYDEHVVGQVIRMCSQELISRHVYFHHGQLFVLLKEEILFLAVTCEPVVARSASRAQHCKLLFDALFSSPSAVVQALPKTIAIGLSQVNDLHFCCRACFRRFQKWPVLPELLYLKSGHISIRLFSWHVSRFKSRRLMPQSLQP